MMMKLAGKKYKWRLEIFYDKSIALFPE